MRESPYTAAVSRLLPATVYALKLNLPYTAGVADSYYSSPDGDHWVEWKYLKRVPRVVDLAGGKNPVITKLQQDWLVSRYKQGRTVSVIVGSEHGGVVFPDLQWQTPITKEEFVKRCVPKRELAKWIEDRCKEGKKYWRDNACTAH